MFLFKKSIIFSVLLNNQTRLPCRCFFIEMRYYTRRVRLCVFTVYKKFLWRKIWQIFDHQAWNTTTEMTTSEWAFIIPFLIWLQLIKSRISPESFVIEEKGLYSKLSSNLHLEYSIKFVLFRILIVSIYLLIYVLGI